MEACNIYNVKLLYEKCMLLSNPFHPYQAHLPACEVLLS